MSRPEPELLTPAASDPSSVMVIGAGIAGASIANALARHGSSVTVLHNRALTSAGASRNPRAIIRPVIARDRNDPLAQFYSAASAFALNRIAQFASASESALDPVRGAHWEHARASELDTSELRAQPATAHTATGSVGITSRDGLSLADTLTVTPAALCDELLRHPLIGLRATARVASIARNGSRWEAFDDAGDRICDAASAVVASGPALAELLPDLSSPFHITHGLSVSMLPNQAGGALNGALLSDVSILPNGKSVVLNGGHWRDRLSRDAAMRLFPWPLDFPVDQVTSSVLARRLHTPDRLPVVGAVPCWRESLETLAPLARGRTPAEPPRYQPDLYTLGALGGRGITSGLWCAELLAAAMHGHLEARYEKTLCSLHPLRFAARAIRRNQQPD